MVKFMKTLKELKGAFIGEMISVLMFELFLEIYGFVTDQKIVWGYEEALIIFGWLGFSMVMTYLGWTLYKGIRGDVKDIKETLKKNKEKEA